MASPYGVVLEESDLQYQDLHVVGYLRVSMPIAWFAHQNVTRCQGHLFPVYLEYRIGHRVEDLGLGPMVVHWDDISLPEGDLLKE